MWSKLPEPGRTSYWNNLPAGSQGRQGAGRNNKIQTTNIKPACR